MTDRHKRKQQEFKSLPPQLLKKLSGIKTFASQTDAPKMILEKVIGFSSRNVNSISVNSTNGDLAYPAGSIVVIYSPN